MEFFVLDNIKYFLVFFNQRTTCIFMPFSGTSHDQEVVTNENLRYLIGQYDFESRHQKNRKKIAHLCWTFYTLNVGYWPNDLGGFSCIWWEHRNVHGFSCTLSARWTSLPNIHHLFFFMILSLMLVTELGENIDSLKWLTTWTQLLPNGKSWFEKDYFACLVETKNIVGVAYLPKYPICPVFAEHSGCCGPGHNGTID